MQIHVVKNRRYQTTLRRSSVAFLQLHPFHDPCLQKHHYVANEGLVCDVVFEKLDQPLLIEIVEESFDVCL